MDFIRFPYNTKCRFFRDDPTESTIKWYAAAATAKPFPVPHKFGSLRWTSEPWLAEGIGEVYDSPNTFNGDVSPPGLIGDHSFGPLENFQQGVPFDDSFITQRNAFGLALGCLPPELLNVILMEETGEPPILPEDDEGWILLEDQG